MTYPRLIGKHDLWVLFTELGITRGSTVMVHSALRGLGYLINGPRDIINALMECVGPDGTIIAPSFSGQLTDPAQWSKAAMPPEWHEKIRAEMQPFDSRHTPTRSVGILSQALVHCPGAMRSTHPTHSIVALGKHATDITANHPLHSGQGADSPFPKIYSHDPLVLFMGVGLESCTLIHMAEFIVHGEYTTSRTSRVLHTTGHHTVFTDMVVSDLDTRSFNKLHEPLEAENALIQRQLGNYTVMVMNGRKAVDMAVEKLTHNIDFFLSPDAS